MKKTFYMVSYKNLKLRFSRQLIEMKISSSFVVWGDNEKTLILISDLKLVQDISKQSVKSNFALVRI